MRHVYLDESGSHAGAPLLTMAGYIFEDVQAARFSREWAKDLERLGLPHAHMTDCATGNGHYRDMSKEDRIKSEKLLIEKVKRRSIVGFGVTVDPAHYDEVCNSEPGIPSAYSFCVLCCVHSVNRWANKIGYTGKFSYFFEAGHESQHEADFVMRGIPEGGNGKMEEYRYHSHGFYRKNEAAPLQAADMLAWQTYHYHKRMREGFKKPRADFVALLRKKDYVSDYSRSNVEEYKSLLLERVQRREG